MPIEPEKGNPPHFRQNIPHWNNLDRYPVMQRPDFTQNNPHYEGDIARSIIYPNQPTSYERFNRLKGELYFDKNNKIWNYTDEEIIKTLKEILSQKYKIDKNGINVRIDRNLNKIFYEYLYYIKSATEGEKINVKLLEVGDIIQLHPQIYSVLNTFTEPRFVEKYKITENDLWYVAKKTKDNILLVLQKNNRVVLEYTKDIIETAFGDTVILVKKGEKHLQRDFKQKAEPYKIKFKDLPDGAIFVFYDITDELIKKGIKWNTFLRKKGEKAIELKQKKRFKVDPEALVIEQKQFEKTYKYSPEDLSDIFESLFTKYKKYKTNVGEYVLLPYSEFEEIVKTSNVPFSKFQSFSRTIKTKDGEQYVGNYTSEEGDKYTWIYDKNKGEIKITRLG